MNVIGDALNTILGIFCVLGVFGLLFAAQETILWCHRFCKRPKN